MSVLLVTSEGELVSPGRILTATAGPYRGRRLRFVDIHHDAERIVCHLLHPSVRHARVILHPSHFGLELRRELTRMARTFNRLHHTWQHVDEWLWAGAFALVPLAIFEAFHGGEATREFLLSVMGREGH
jgi:hypothetical protein